MSLMLFVVARLISENPRKIETPMLCIGGRI